MPLWKVDGSFYVEADTAENAERKVSREVNGGPVQKLIGDTVGDLDVHEGKTEPWDLDG